MGRWYFSGFLFLLVALSVNKANGFPAGDLVKELPGQPKVGFRQFAGYGATSENSTKALFYYFVEAEGNATRKPLTLWLNGGPGCSSVGGGAFTELGPFFPKGDGRGLRRNRLSWNKASNLLFVDSPVGVGWSYSNLNPEIPSSDASSAEDLYLFLLTWYENFPAFKNRDLFLTGESYAGHFIPQLAELLLNHNMRKTSFKFKIKGIALGNSLLKASSDITARYNYLWSHGMISAETGDTLIKECDFEKFQYVKPHNLSEKCNTLMDEADQAASDYTNQYNVLLDVCYPAIVKQELQLRKMASRISLGVDVCMEFEIENYLNLIEVQKALHVTEDNQTYSWKTCNDYILYKGEDGDNNMLPLLKRMVQNKIPVLIFSGDQDAMIPLFSSRKLVKELAEELKLGVTLPYGPWFHKTQVGGWQIEYGNILTFATVRGGSHMVPLTQPSRALHLFKSFIYGRRLPNRTFPMDAPDAVEHESTEGEVELSGVEN